jgi:hypothetical protein
LRFGGTIFLTRYLPSKRRFIGKIHPAPEKVKMNSFNGFLPYTSPDGIRAFYRLFQKCPV